MLIISSGTLAACFTVSFVANIYNFRFFIDRKIQNQEMKSNGKQIFIFVYTTVSFLLLILVALGFLAGTLIITKIEDEHKRNRFFDRYFGSLKILFTLHDFMFSTIVLGVFYMLGKKK